MDYLYLNKQTLSNAIREMDEGKIITFISLHTCIVIEIPFVDGRISILLFWLIQHHVWRNHMAHYVDIYVCSLQLCPRRMNPALTPIDMQLCLCLFITAHGCSLGLKSGALAAHWLSYC